MAKQRHIVSNNEIMSFNWTREAMVGKEMSLDELKKQLKRLTYSPAMSFVQAITGGENPPIIHVKRGCYVFNPKPVHIDRLRKVWDDYRKTRTKQTTEHIATTAEIQTAIKLLKDNGYRVLKQITKYEEV